MYKVIFDRNENLSGEIKFAVLDKVAPVTLIVKKGIVKNESDAKAIFDKLDVSRNYCKILLFVKDKAPVKEAKAPVKEAKAPVKEAKAPSKKVK